LGSVALEYTYQNSTGNRTTEYVSNYKNVVTPTTGSATNVEYTYTYDANGNIASDSLGGILKHSYVYDEAGQLVRVNDAEQNKTFCYTYDNGGNLVSKKRYAYTLDSLGSVLQTMGTYAYMNSNWKDELTSYNNIPLTYDNIGNLICFDNNSFTWSAGRQLEKFEISLRDYSVNYKYNADGLRTQKIIDDVENYMQITYDYIWMDGKLVSQTDGTDILYFLYDSKDSPIGFVLNDAATYLYIKNLQGDITGIADGNGNIIVNYTYDEWGKLLSITGSEADIIGLLNPLRYRGYYYDTETGYYYLQSRYYNPKWGRFINADVYCDTGSGVVGTNMFTYCRNNVVNHIDPTGKFEKEWHMIVTLRIARTVYKEEYAKKLADGDYYIDKNHSTSATWGWNNPYAQSWHFNVYKYSQTDSRDRRTEEMLDEALVSLSVAKSYLTKGDKKTAEEKLKNAFFSFGKGLHPQQDKVAHSGPEGNKFYGNIAYHPHKVKQDGMMILFDSPGRHYYELDKNGNYYNTGWTIGQMGEFVTALYMVNINLKVRSYGLSSLCRV